MLEQRTFMMCDLSCHADDLIVPGVQVDQRCEPRTATTPVIECAHMGMTNLAKIIVYPREVGLIHLPLSPPPTFTKGSQRGTDLVAQPSLGEESSEWFKIRRSTYVCGHVGGLCFLEL